ncbi:MAG: hypothetical protein QM783_05185 [Phycisphaerales bacterium]
MLASRQPVVPPGAHRSPVTLQDLLDDLLWPQLLRTWKLALAPGRVAMCFLFVLVAGAVMLLAWSVTKDDSGNRVNAVGTLSNSVRINLLPVTQPVAAGKATVAQALYDAFIKVPGEFFRDHPWVSLLCLPVILLVWCFVGGAVCRSCACEVSLRAALPWRKAVVFGLRKTPANAAGVAGPLAAVWAASLLLLLLGKLFFMGKVISVVGALLFIFPLLLCLVVALAMVAYLFAHPLLIPAVACEGTDSFDAVQRCYAYVLARPGRLAGYALISLLATLPAAFVVGVIGSLGVYAAVTLTGAPSPASPTAIFFPDLLRQSGGEPYAITTYLLTAWIWLAGAICLSYFISLYFCAATNLYLVMRRLVDGQDVADLWTPPSPATHASIPAAPVAPVAQTPPSIPDKADYT